MCYIFSNWSDLLFSHSGWSKMGKIPFTYIDGMFRWAIPTVKIQIWATNRRHLTCFRLLFYQISLSNCLLNCRGPLYWIFISFKFNQTLFKWLFLQYCHINTIFLSVSICFFLFILFPPSLHHICLYMYLYICLSVCLSICLSVCHLVHPSNQIPLTSIQNGFDVYLLIRM